MKKIILSFIVLLFWSCEPPKPAEPIVIEKLPTEVKQVVKAAEEAPSKKLELTLDQADLLASLPMQCVDQEYPNKLGQVLGSEEDLLTPKELHPAFYGCFDWHSSVHGHWSMVKLLREFPNLEMRDTMISKLMTNITVENIAKEVEYFDNVNNKNFERTYGWAWLLKLSEELELWDDPVADTLQQNMQPLTNVMVGKITEFLPKLLYPIRVGTHTNTAFGLTFAYDYAVTMKNDTLKQLITNRAIDYYMLDKECPISWEPSGYDFLSPCLEEIDLMRRILNPPTFKEWMLGFAPNMSKRTFSLEVARVSDREDGHLVHLDGLNLSRAWVFYGLASQYPEYNHLIKEANKHVKHSLPNLVGDSYEGGHWLGSFALYTLGK